MIFHPGQILHSALLSIPLILLGQTLEEPASAPRWGGGEKEPCVCSHPTPTPSSNEISALCKTGPGKIHIAKSVALWASPNSMLPSYDFTMCASHHSPDLSSHLNPVTGRDGKPKRRDICIVGIAF